MQPTPSKAPSPELEASASSAELHMQASAQFFSSPIAPPEVLEALEKIVPGSARELLSIAQREADHICTMQAQELQATIAERQGKLEIARYQSRAIFRSDLFGQMAGFVLSLTCIGAATWLAMHDRQWTAIALSAIPSAAVIRAFFSKR